MTSLSFNLLAMDANEVMQNYIKNIDNNSRMVMEMKFMDKSKKTLGLRVVEKWQILEGNNLRKKVLNIKKPSKYTGIRELIIENSDRENDLFQFKPSTRKVRRMLASEFSASYLEAPEGTLTNEDMELVKVGEYKFAIIKEETVGNEACYVVEMKKKNSKNTQYSKVLNWISKDKYVSMKREFYNKSEKLVKKENQKGTSPSGTNWYNKFVVMKNIENGMSVMYRIPRALFGDKARVNSKIFTQRYLKTGKAN